nr:cytochrome P450 [Salinispora arenicola]
MIAARDEDGSLLTEQELVDTIFAILGAGSETTINFFDNAITQLLTHPEQLELVKSGQVSWDDVIEEVLRLESPLASLPMRFAVEDIQLDGVTIHRGDPILINYAALGRDPALHGESAGVFDVTRQHKEHLSFGHGAHYCLGAGIARMVAKTGLSALFERFPRMTLAVSAKDLVPYPTFIMNGNRQLLVHLSGAHRGVRRAVSARPGVKKRHTTHPFPGCGLRLDPLVSLFGVAMEKCPYVLDRAGSDIHKEASNLRARGPVTLVELHGGYTAWSVTSYEAAKQLLMDPRISKNTKAHWPEFRDGNVPQDWELYTWVAMDNMQTRDGKEHDRLRKLVAPAFTGRQAVKSRPIIEESVNRLPR